MNREGLRVIGPAIASVAAIAAATLGLEWFIANVTGLMELSRITFDLREARACSSLGPCGVVPMSMIKSGMYPTLAAISFWGSIVFALLVLYQAGSRILGGFANESITKAAHGLGSLVIITSVGAGYLFGPSLTPGEMMGLGFDVDRGWGPLTMLLGLILGHVALYTAREGGLDDAPPYRPVAPLPVATARPPLPTSTPAAGMPTAAPVSPRTHAPTTPPPMQMPDAFKGKIRFSVVTGEVTVAGIDARREDGGSVLVMWRDVVGLVVRRLPPELDGHPFVDIVSTADMTLRVLPWSKLTGETLEGDSEGRVRAFVKLVKARAPEAKLDRATQSFFDDNTARPAQLPSLELLAKHDQALA